MDNLNPGPRSSDAKQKITPRELAIQKIRRLATANGGDQAQKKKSKKGNIRGTLQRQLGKDEKRTRKITQDDRRNSFPLRSTSSAGPSSECSSMSTNSAPVTARRFSAGDAPQVPVAGSSSSASSSVKLSAQARDPKKAKFLDTSQLKPFQKGPNPRKSSFPLRKRQDNQLGYQPRRDRHRHHHQAVRERKLISYEDGVPYYSSDDE